MELKKCNRCGSFFVTVGDLCPNCSQKDSADIVKLENYVKEYNYPENLEEISYNTGISLQNLNRHIANNPEFIKKLRLD